MDTHVNDASLAHPGIGLATPIGLPGESAREPAETVPQRPGFGGGGSDPGLVTDNDLSQALDAKQRRRARRQALLAGSAFIAISGLVGSTAYVFQDDIRNGNVRNISLQSIHLPASVSGLFLSASGTRSAVQEVRALSRTTVGPVFPAAAAPRAVAGPAFEAGSGAALGPSLASVVLPVPVQPTATPAVTDRRAVLAAELAALKVSGTADTAVESAPQLTPARQLDDAKLLLPPVIPMAVSPVAPVQALVAEPELTLPLRVAVPPVAVVLVSPPAVVLAPTVAPPPSREPAAIAADLRAGPMTPAQQVEVIGLVKSLGAQLRDTRIEVAQLHRVVTQLSNQVETKTTDFDSRLSLAEAAAIVQSSARAGNVSPDPAPSQLSFASSAAPTRLASARGVVPQLATAPVMPVAPAADRRTVKDYVVRGASPGLAVLAALNPASSGSSVIEVGVGDTVPGVGRIKRVYQRGTTWIVDTDNGSIQQ